MPLLAHTDHAQITASAAIGKHAVVHVLEGMVSGACDDDGFTYYSRPLLPGSPFESQVKGLDYPFLTGPHRPYLPPVLTMLGPTDEVWSSGALAGKRAWLGLRGRGGDGWEAHASFLHTVGACTAQGLRFLTLLF